MDWLHFKGWITLYDYQTGQHSIQGGWDGYRENVRKGFSEKVEFKLQCECSGGPLHRVMGRVGGMASAKVLRQGWEAYGEILEYQSGWKGVSRGER